MKKFKVRIKKAPKMDMGGYMPMYQVGGQDPLPTLDEPGYYSQAPQAAAPVAPVPTDSLMRDTTAVAPQPAVVTKTPQGAVKKAAPKKQGLAIDPNNNATPFLDYAVPFGTGLAAGAGLFGGYKMMQKSTAAADATAAAARGSSIVTPYNPKNTLQIASREMKAKSIVDAIKNRGAYSVDELAELKQMGVTEEYIRNVMSTSAKAAREMIPELDAAAAARRGAGAAKAGEGMWDAVKAGYSALRATPWIKALRKEDGGEMGYYQEGGDPDSTLENVVEFLDPTGVSSYDDVYRTFQDPESKWWEKGLSVAGALPIVGKFGKAAKVVGELSKAKQAMRIAGRVMTPVAQMDKYVNPVSRFVAGATAKGLENAPKAVKAVANFGSMSNQANRFWNGSDMLMGYPGKEYGGEMEQMAYGGQMGYGLELNSRRVYTDMPPSKQDGIGRVLQPVDEEDATYEAERNEVLVGDVDKDGQDEMMVFGGKRHTQGGTPANKPGFIFSDTKNLRMKGPIVEEFGKTAGKKQYTPAELAKQYDLNKYKAVLDDDQADETQRRTAEIMIDNYQKKLGKLAMVQESMKGFPQGVPEIAAKAFPELAEQMQQPQGEQQPMNPAEAAYGGYYAYGGVPQMQNAGATPKQLPEWFQFFTKANTPKGAISRTGKPTTYDPGTGNAAYDDYDYWQKMALQDGRKEFSGRKDMQEYVFNKLIQENPGAINGMVKDYGYPSAHTLADGVFGARSAQAFKQRLRTNQPNLIPSKMPAQIKVNIPLPGIPANPMNPTGAAAQQPKPGQPYLPYHALDKANLLEAISRPVKSYGPRMFLPDVQETQGYYDQPDYNPLLSAANTRAQMNNTFGNTGAAMAANSYNPDLYAGLIQETNRSRANNLQTANQISSANTDIRNKSNVMNAEMMGSDYDKWVKTQEETDTAKKLKMRKDIIPAAGNMLNNRAQMQAKNMMYPEFAVAGNFWQDMPFAKGYRVGSGDQPSAAAGTREDFYARYPAYKEAYNSGDLKTKMEVDKLYMQHVQQTRQAMSRNPSNYMGNMYGPNANMFMQQDPDNPIR